MPFTSAFSPYLTQTKQRRSDMETTAYVPVYKHGFIVSKTTYHVWANYDEAFFNTYNLAATICFEDETFKRHPVPDAEVRAVLDDIRIYDPEAWREIKERAEENYLEGTALDFAEAS